MKTYINDGGLFVYLPVARNPPRVPHPDDPEEENRPDGTIWLGGVYQGRYAKPEMRFAACPWLEKPPCAV